MDNQRGEVSVNAPISALVGIGLRTARDLTAKPRVVELLFKRPQAALDIQ